MSSFPLRMAPRSILRIGTTLLMTLALWSFSVASHGIEEPDYQVVRTLADVEVRQYAGYTVAEVLIDGTADEAGNQAFRILAAYIFGKNKGERSIANSAPATQIAEPTKLAMAAPVTEMAAARGFLIQFVLPRGVTAATAPEPVDTRIRIRDMPPSQVAVIRYSGFWSESNYNEHLAKLQAVLRAADLAWAGEAVYARYNAPFTPWFLRRNEIWLHVVRQP